MRPLVSHQKSASETLPSYLTSEGPKRPLQGQAQCRRAYE